MIHPIPTFTKETDRHGERFVSSTFNAFPATAWVDTLTDFLDVETAAEQRAKCNALLLLVAARDHGMGVRAHNRSEKQVDYSLRARFQHYDDTMVTPTLRYLRVSHWGLGASPAYSQLGYRTPRGGSEPFLVVDTVIGDNTERMVVRDSQAPVEGILLDAHQVVFSEVTARLDNMYPGFGLPQKLSDALGDQMPVAPLLQRL